MAVFGVGLVKLAVALLLAGKLRPRSRPASPPSVHSHSEAVLALRDRLAASLPRAGFNDRVYLWGVWLPSHGALVGAQESVVLSSFLRARRWSVDEAEHMVTSALGWRREQAVESLHPRQFGSLPCELRAHRDPHGRLLVLFRLDELEDKCFHDSQRFVRWRVFMQEGEPR